MSSPFRFTGRIRSFTFAGQGLWLTLKTQHNARIHAIATLAVALLGWVFGISRMEWCVIVLACAAVWTAEALNTAFEFLADATIPEFHPVVRDAKDIAAGAVLVTAVGATVIGALIFWPYVAKLIS